MPILFRTQFDVLSSLEINKPNLYGSSSLEQMDFPPVFALPRLIPWKFKDKIGPEIEIVCIIIQFHCELKSVYKDKLLMMLYLLYSI